MLACIYSEDKKLALREKSMPLQTDDNAVIRVGASSPRSGSASAGFTLAIAFR
jgi:hypothetical protein